MSHEYFKGLGHGPADIEPGIEVFDEHGEHLGTVAEVRDHYIRISRSFKSGGWLPQSAFIRQQDNRLHTGFPARRWDEFVLKEPGATNLHVLGLAGEEVGVPMFSGADEPHDDAGEASTTGPVELEDIAPAARSEQN